MDEIKRISNLIYNLLSSKLSAELSSVSGPMLVKVARTDQQIAQLILFHLMANLNIKDQIEIANQVATEALVNIACNNLSFLRLILQTPSLRRKILSDEQHLANHLYILTIYNSEAALLILNDPEFSSTLSNTCLYHIKHQHNSHEQILQLCQYESERRQNFIKEKILKINPQQLLKDFMILSAQEVEKLAMQPLVEHIISCLHQGKLQLHEVMDFYAHYDKCDKNYRECEIEHRKQILNACVAYYKIMSHELRNQNG